MDNVDLWNKRHEAERPTDPRRQVVSYIEDYITGHQGIDIPKTKVLDFGCGNGRNLAFLLNSGFDAVGFDPSDNARQRAIDLIVATTGLDVSYAASRVHNADMRQRLPYEDNYFEIIINFGVLQQTTYDGIEQAFSDMNRILKSGGEIFFHTISNKQVQFGEVIERPRYHIEDGGVVVDVGPTLELGIDGEPIQWHFFSEEELKNLANRNGFRIKSLTEYTHQKKNEEFLRVSWEGILVKK